MLSPCVLTYVVLPPSELGRNSHTAASSSAATALSRAVRAGEVMVGSGRQSGVAAALPEPMSVSR